MTKFNDSKFQVAANTGKAFKKYTDNYDKIFSKKPKIKKTAITTKKSKKDQNVR